MPRPQKKRFVCRLPQTEKFFPSKITNTDYVKMTVDEYEAIRLIDLQNCTQRNARHRCMFPVQQFKAFIMKRGEK